MSPIEAAAREIEFQCPQCGGPYFGTYSIGKPDEYVECHCSTDGGSLSMFRINGTLRRAYEIGQPCGWRGKRSEAFKEVSE